tara:strand:+ start:1609 stop:2991 length:1383 start_codon:yes stop_codon:yes gene_type:complete
MASEVFSQSLAYPQMKQRAISSRSFRTKISPSNSQSFTMGQTINLDLPSNMSGTYYNYNQMYLKFKVTNGDATAVTLDRAGAACLIKRIQIQTAGANLYDCDKWNVLYTALMDTEASAEWKGSIGNILTGTSGSNLGGETIGAAGERTFCIPMVLNPLANTTPHRLIPAFSLSSIQYRITLDDAATALVGTAGIANSEIVVSDVEMVCLMTELSPSAQAQVDSMTGGVYNILANSYMNSSATMTAASQVTANLGFSVSSLERILLVQRQDATFVNADTKFTIGNRAPNGLSEYQYLINSESYPSRPIIVEGNQAEACAELLIANHSLTDYRAGNTLNNNPVKSGALVSLCNQSGSQGLFPNAYSSESPAGTSVGVLGADNAGTTGGNIGTALFGCEFETGLSDGKSSTIYSGVSTLASNVQFLGKYANAGTTGATLDFFGMFSVLISLDMKGSGVFSVSV